MKGGEMHRPLFAVGIAAETRPESEDSPRRKERETKR